MRVKQNNDFGPIRAPGKNDFWRPTPSYCELNPNNSITRTRGVVYPARVCIPTVEIDTFDPASCKPIFVAPHPLDSPHYPHSNNIHTTYMMTTCPQPPGTPQHPLCPRQRASFYRLLSATATIIFLVRAFRHTSATAVCPSLG